MIQEPLLICGINTWVQSVLWGQNTDPNLGSGRPTMLEILGGRLTETYQCWPSLYSLLKANYVLTDPCIGQNKYEEKESGTPPFTQRLYKTLQIRTADREARAVQ